MQDEKGRRAAVPTADTLWRVFNDNFSYLPPAHAVRRSQRIACISGGKLSEPRQSHRLQTRIAASIGIAIALIYLPDIVELACGREPEAISSRFLLRDIADDSFFG